ncbi:MAG TPA: long-chain fatty acid--CoA ligase [Gemmatimonadaceae bacterium]|nr:long-chain fatty acid--CoA ligase [Gemmatimonadaceae bacterium]
MHGLMMDYELTIPTLVRRAEQLHAGKEIVSRRPDRSLHRTTYGEVIRRARSLAGALRALGVAPGDRVATFCWNHARHLEAYYGVPSMGAVLHTLNIRLHPDELTYVATHAGDKVALVDRVLWPQFERFRDRVGFAHVIVVGDGEPPIPGTLDYEALLEGADAHDFDTVTDERWAAAMCYTSGTTGRPKAAVYSHRSTVLHTLGMSLADLDLCRETDTVLAMVPMFHANAWGSPYSGLMTGARQVLPGPHLDSASLLELLAGERVTVALGVPTIWSGILQLLDRDPGAYDLSRLRVAGAGGAAMPEALFRALDRHGVHMVHLWGMTEMSPLGSHARLTARVHEADADVRHRYRATQGRPVPLVEIRARGEGGGLVPWDGATMGELEVRGPWVVGAYYDAPESADRFTADGWFRTGDIVTIEQDGWITICDRDKDVIKSGGEWISSVALENALMSHPAVAEAMVVGLPHPQWDERPLALVVRREGSAAAACTPDDLLAHLAPHFPKWWLPSAVEFVDALPRTSVGKLDKKLMRQRYSAYFLAPTTSASLADLAERTMTEPTSGRR